MCNYQPLNSQNITLPVNYPYNLLFAVKGQTDLNVPGILTYDIRYGIQYALSTLENVEQTLLHTRYYDGKSPSETAMILHETEEWVKYTEAKALRKLRLFSRWGYIQYGIAGFLKKETDTAYHKGYQTGYRDAIANTTEKAAQYTSSEDVFTLPIQYLNLSSRAFNCLYRHGYTRIGEIISLDADSIQKMRNLGKISANEIACALTKLGIRDSAWAQFLL